MAEGLGRRTEGRKAWGQDGSIGQGAMEDPDGGWEGAGNRKGGNVERKEQAYSPQQYATSVTASRGSIPTSRSNTHRPFSADPSGDREGRLLRSLMLLLRLGRRWWRGAYLL